MDRRAILFWLMIVTVVGAGIYLRTYRAEERAPLIAHKNWARCVEATSDSGFIIAGVKWGVGGIRSAMYLVRTDTHGRKLWCKTFGHGDVNQGNSVQQTLDLGYIVAGTTWPKNEKHRDMYIVKTDASGNKLWDGTYGGKWRDEANSVRQTGDGGYIVAGQSDSVGNGFDDVCLLKIDALGNELWCRTYGGDRKDEGYSVLQTADGDFIVVGNTRPLGRMGQSKMLLFRIDGRGEEMWVRRFGGEGSTYGYSVCATMDGFVAAGKMVNPDKADEDICLIKTDADGNMVWAMTGTCP